MQSFVVIYFAQVSKCTLQLVQTMLLQQLQKLSPHIKYWRSEPKQPVLLQLQTYYNDWRTGKPSTPYNHSARLKLATLLHMQKVFYDHVCLLGRVRSESFFLQVGRLQHFLTQMDKVVDFKDDIEHFAEGIEFVTETYVTGDKHQRINNPMQVLTVLFAWA